VLANSDRHPRRRAVRVMMMAVMAMNQHRTNLKIEHLLAIVKHRMLEVGLYFRLRPFEFCMARRSNDC
jgi:hypothetical protein